ncbi:MAG: hypothetical protein WCJ86_01855 [Candidatus Saccharibacteria bacterium]
MFLEFFYWWYGTGYLDTIKRVSKWITATSQIFSIKILITTLFSPWKRIVTESDGSLEMILKSIGDNAVSRAIGFFVRSTALFTSLILTSVTSVVGLVMIILWPLMPVGVAISLFMALFGGFVK